MCDLVGNPKDWFSHNEAHKFLAKHTHPEYLLGQIPHRVPREPHSAATHRDMVQKKTLQESGEQVSLQSHRVETIPQSKYHCKDMWMQSHKASITAKPCRSNPTKQVSLQSHVEAMWHSTDSSPSTAPDPLTYFSSSTDWRRIDRLRASSQVAYKLSTHPATTPTTTRRLTDDRRGLVSVMCLMR